MCGIAGISRFDGTAVDPALLHAMADRLGHRGPDDRGVWNGGSTGFAHTRLSIIDRAGSRQPMTSADGRYTLVYNGEVFNYRHLRDDLDYPFTTDGDTEVLLAGIALRGIGFIDRLVGQFAFALHDSTTGVTHLVRDRVGILPLHYTSIPGAIVYASEVKAILPALPHTPSVDLLSLDAYLYGRSVPAPDTLYEGIHKLQPGHRAELHPDGTVRIVRYWQPPEEEDNGPRWTEGQAVDAVDVAVTQAVDSALVADVPVGAYLSGGVDSSLIVAKVAALRPGRTVHTFSAGFGDKRNDELGWARSVAERFDTEHHEVTVDAGDFEELWPRLTYFRDAPLSEPADIAVFRLAEAARTTVHVILSGEGGDELFAGYPKYLAARAVQLATHLPAGLRSGAARLDPLLPARLGRARIALRVTATRDAEDRYRTWFAPFTASERNRLLTGVPSRRATAPDTGDADEIRAMLLTDLWSWLPDNLLERGDRMSMAASLELRPPLLDHRLVELAFRMPSTFKVRHGSTKWLLKEVARRYLPDEVVDRRKVGFRVPLDAWFRSGLREAMWDRLTGPGSFVGETFDRAAVRSLLMRHESGAYSEENRIFTLLSLEVWHEAAFGRARTPSPAC